MKRLILLAILLCTASLGLNNFSALAQGRYSDTVYLRDGRAIRGTLLGFDSGRFVVRVEPTYTTMQGAPADSEVTRPQTAEGEIQYFRPNEVNRIEIGGRSIDGTRLETRTVQVTLDSNWTDSGIDLRRGERVQVSASGVITVGRSRITPDGLQRTDPTAPLPNAKEGQLIGAVSDDTRAPIMELGSSREFTADRDGRLYLTANRGAFNDARGSFTVQIKRQRNLAFDQGDTYPPRRNPLGRSRTPQSDTAPREVTIDVPGMSRGTDTGVDVRAGDQITFDASGIVIAGPRVGKVGPEGGRASGFSAKPVPSAGPGALIGYIQMPNGQTSPVFLIGRQLIFTATADGRLFLAINDDNYNDNSGSFSVIVRF